MATENTEIIINTTVENKESASNKSVEKYKQIFKTVDFSQLSSLIIQDLLNQKKESLLFAKYSKEEVINFLKSPQNNEKQIRNMSIYLYNNSPQYRRLCNYFSKLCTLNYTIFPYNLKSGYNKKSFLLNYNKVVKNIDKLNMKYHLDTIFNICLYQDIYCGLYYETEDSFDVIQINPDYTRIVMREDGSFIFELNFDFFRTREYLLDSYGIEINQMYLNYKGYTIKRSDGTQETVKGDKKLQWQIPSKQMCFKINSDQLLYSLPPFAGVFPEILNLEDYKLLRKNEEILKNYKILAMNIPLNDDGKFKLDGDIAKEFYNQACNNVDGSIGMVLTPMKLEKFDFDSSKAAESNAVNEAEGSVWSATGTHGGLIGWGEKQSASTVKLSINNDESIMFSMLRQVEKWINRYIKKMNLPFDFKVSYLNQTIYNIKDVCDKYEKAATHGVPGSRLLYGASIDLSPSDMICADALENDLGMIENWIPLKSSNTMSSSEDAGGKPVQDTVEDAGEQTREDDENANR